MSDKEPLKGLTVLIADDEEYLREVIGERLQMAGADTLLASHGQEALRIFLAKDAIDFVISDVRMPGGDGINLIKSIRSSGRPLPPFLFITGFSDLNQDEALKLGALGLLSKPFQMKEIVDLIAKTGKSSPKNS